MISSAIVQAVEKRELLKMTAAGPPDLSLFEPFFQYALERKAIELPSELEFSLFFAEYFHYSRIRQSMSPFYTLFFRLFFVKDHRLVRALFSSDEEKALRLIRDEEISESPVEVEISLDSIGSRSAIFRAEVRPREGLLSLLISFYNGFPQVFRAIVLKYEDSFKIASDTDIERILSVCELELSESGKFPPISEAVMMALLTKRIRLSQDLPRSSFVLRSLKEGRLDSKSPLSPLIKAVLAPAKVFRPSRNRQKVL